MGKVITAQDTSIFAHRIKVERAKAKREKLLQDYANELDKPYSYYKELDQLNDEINAPLPRHDEAQRLD